MIKASVGLLGIDETVVRPILIKTINDVKNVLGFTKDTKYFLDEHDKVDNEKNKLGDITGYSSNRREYIEIEYEEDISPETELSLININPDYQPIYVDSDIESKITPNYLKRNMTISFKYFNKSKSLINNVINRLRLLPTKNRLWNQHDLEYHYVLPSYVVKLLMNINDNKNSRLTTPISFEEYLNNTFDTRLDTTNTPDGDSLLTDIVIRETQLGAIGKFNTDLATIKKELLEDKSGWIINFEYVIEYELPIELVLDYPILVYNSLINHEFRSFIKKPISRNKGNFTKGTGGMMDIVNGGTSDYLTIPDNSYYLRIPDDDTFLLPRPHPNLARVLSILAVIDDTMFNTLFNLSEIPNITFKQEILDFLKYSDYQYVTDIYSSMLYFELYKNGKPDSDNSIIMDSDLNLTTVNPMDIKAVYRVAISVVTNVQILKEEHQKRIKKYISTTTDNNNNSELVKYFAMLFGIPSELLPNRNNDFTLLLNIEDNNWREYYTQQTHLVLTNLFDEK